MISYMLVYHPKTLGSILRQVISTFQFGYPHVTLKEGSKVKSDKIRRFAAHDFLYVGFTLKNSRTNNKGDIRTFKVRYVGYFGTLWMTLYQHTSRSNVCKVVKDMYICYTYHHIYEEIQTSTYEKQPVEKCRLFSKKCPWRPSCFSE